MTRSRPEGSVYTPPDVVDALLEATLGRILASATPDTISELRIVDPACGDGAFLVRVLQMLLDGYGRRAPEIDPGEILQRHIYGVDIDPVAVDAARRALASLAGAEPPNLRVGNALVDPAPAVDSSLSPFSWADTFPDVFGRERPGFDLIVGNPPYIGADAMALRHAPLRAYCRAHYAAARGNWDLFCVFIERALSLTRPGGQHAFVVPNKLASASYARAVRRVLANEAQVTQVVDYTGSAVFAEAVYPIAYVAEHRAPSPGATVRVRSHTEDVCVPLSVAIPRDGRPWPLFGEDGTAAGLELLASLATGPCLGDIATVRGAATVSEAYALAPLLSTRPAPQTGDLKVLNSGTIDPHQSLWGERPMRYLGQRVPHPVVPADRLEQLPAQRLAQAKTPKLIVAGMTRVLEAYADLDGSHLAAKSTTIVLPEDPADLVWLAGVVNSPVFTSIFRTRHGGLTLSGGYLRVGPPALRAMPLPPRETPGQKSLAKGIAARVLQLRGTNAHARAVLLAEIDDQVRAQYGLDAARS